jgi:Ca2+-binding RTX toxin-like protein
MRGDRGNDLLRGGTGSDCYDGGAADDVLDDSSQFFADQDQYTTDPTWNDYVTYEWPLMVNACM